MKSSIPYSLSEATCKMERYCAYQDRCHKEVVAKLVKMKMIPEAIDHIVVHLIQKGYLNEERFARTFARGKFGIKHWGKKRIITELKQRDVSPYNIRMALAEIDDSSYLKTLDRLARKRLGQLSEKNSLARKRKLSSYLLYRGWESDLVYAKIRELVP